MKVRQPESEEFMQVLQLGWQDEREFEIQVLCWGDPINTGQESCEAPLQVAFKN